MKDSLDMITKSRPAIDLIGDARCTGCSACANACGRSAIEMILSLEGFYRPQIDRSRCNECGICANECPVLATERGDMARAPWTEPKAFAAWSRDEEIHLASSSGGAFTELARLFIQRGGVVCGCGWADDWTPTHMIARTEQDLALFRGSKYVPSSVSDALAETIRLCRNGTPVLFSGTPCQIAAAKRLVTSRGKEYLTTCEVVCQGVPSLRLFRAYLQWLFGGDAIREFSFRQKSLGCRTVVAISRGGKIYQVPLAADPFGRLALVYHLPLMEACFQCAFQKLPRIADITLGDFWGVPKGLDNPKGVSLVLVNSPAGEKLWTEVLKSGFVESAPVDLVVAVAKNPRATGGHWRQPWLRRLFLQDVARGWSFRKLLWKYHLPLRTIERIRVRVELFFKRLG